MSAPAPALLEPLIVPTKGAQLPRAPSIPKPPGPTDTRRRVIRIVVVATLVIVAYLVHSRLITTVIQDQRQQHLAAQLHKPSPTIGDGDALGVLQIEEQSLSVVYVEGVTVDHLRGAPTHLRGSGLPGDAGVMVLYGHRTVYGGPFADIGAMVGGDSVVIQARNGGPIVRYVVDRTERDVHLADVDLPNSDQIAYLLLVTSEPGFFQDDQTVVVARALPVTDAEATVPDLTAPLDTGAPFGIDALLACVAFCGAVLSGNYLRPRTSQTVVVVVVLPTALFAAITLMMLVDSALPLTH